MTDRPFPDVDDAQALSFAIIDTVPMPLLVLDLHLRVVFASRAFYSAFSVAPADTQGRFLYELSDRAWDIPDLRKQLQAIIPDHGTMDNYEFEHDFPKVGLRSLRLHARELFYATGIHTTILLTIEDVSRQRVLEAEKDCLIKEKDILLVELQHRVANSLQIIASIIMLKARTVESEDTRRHLQDAHKRVISVAAMQRHLHASVSNGRIDMQPYLQTLCEALSEAMIGDERPITLKVVGSGGCTTGRNAESLGLIVAELVMNSLKHAFNDGTRDGRITVSYDVAGTDWMLTVADNGVGKPDGVFAQPKTGLGTGVVKALAKQLDAKVVTKSGVGGTSVTVTHATFDTSPPQELTPVGVST